MTRRYSIFAALAVAAALALPASALADGVQPVAHISEKALRTFETRLLGPQHAAEHARLRALERQQAAKARRHARWLRSLPLAVRRTVERKERLSKRTAEAKQRAYLTKMDASFDPAVSGKWSQAPFPLNTANGDHVMGINAAMLPTGKVLLYSYPTNPNPSYGGGTGSPNEATAFVWDPSKGIGVDSFTEFKPPEDPADPGHPANIWCSGISFLSDGTVLVTGGNSSYLPDWKGLDTIYTFNPFTEKWHYEGKMNNGRWYPTQVQLPDGRTVIMSGYDRSGTPAYNNDIEVYDPSKPEGQRIYRIATRNGGTAGSTNHPPTGGLYPHNFLMPSGNVLVTGPFIEDSWYIRAADVPTSTDAGLPWTNLASVGTAWVGQTWYGQNAAGTVVTRTVDSGGRDQLWGSAVIVPSTDPGNPSTKVMLLGGNYPDTSQAAESDYAVRYTEQIDDANKGAGWTQTPSLNVGRGHGNTVILPDGTMVEVGGGYGIISTPQGNNNQWLTDGGSTDSAHGNAGSQHQVELWNPNTKLWSLGPAQVEGRAYHSTALLMPDGRVLSTGDDWNGSDPAGNQVQGGTYGISDDTAEIYSPPYLFKGARPTITNAPTGTPYGGTLSVDTPDTNVTRAALVAPSATTHANDMNQRYVALSVKQRSGGVNLTVPTSANVAPPGYYMLFLINSNGVPSVATWVRVGAGLPQAPINTAPPTISGAAAIGSTLSTTSLGSWSGDSVTFARQWRRCNTFGESCSDIGGATSTTYTVAAADAGSTLRLRVIGSNSSGSIPSDSAPTTVVPSTAGCPCPDGSGAGGCATCTGPLGLDKTAPKLSFHTPSRRTLKALLKSGLTLRVKCSEACTVSGTLYLQATIRAKSGKKTKTKIRLYLIGRSKTASASSGGKTVTVRIKLTSSGRKRLRYSSLTRMRLSLTAKDKAGNKAKATRTIRLLR